jgi:hypothetical protein
MDEAELKHRTKQFAPRCIKLADSLPGIVVASIRTARSNSLNPKSKIQNPKSNE